MSPISGPTHWAGSGRGGLRERDRRGVPASVGGSEGRLGAPVFFRRTRDRRDGCRSAWYRPRHYPPDATPPPAPLGSQVGSHHHPTQGDREPTEAFDTSAVTRHS